MSVLIDRAARRLAARYLTIATLALAPLAAWAEPIEEIVVGAYYYRSGLVQDPKVQVIAVDKEAGRVKVLDIETSNVDWISPDRLLNRTDSTSRDMNRVLLGLRVIDALLAPPADDLPVAQRDRWVPGSAHPQHANVVASTEEGVWWPAPGYYLPDGAGWNVIWEPGQAHRDHPHVLAGETVDRWRPDPGYEWVDKGKSWSVRWKPGKPHPERAQIAAIAEGQWLDAADWQINEKEGDDGPYLMETLRQPHEPRAPTTVRRMFKPSEFDLYVNKVTTEVYLFHLTEVDYDLVSHIISTPTNDG